MACSRFRVLFCLLVPLATLAQTPPQRAQAQYTRIYFDDFETAPTIGPGLQLFSPGNPPGQKGSALVTTDPSLVIDGKASVRLGWFGQIVTNPATLSLTGNNTYIVEFRYHILNSGADFDILHLDLQPAGSSDPSLQVNFAHLKKDMPTSGTFSSGSFLAPASTPYVLTITSQSQTDLVIDNFAVYRQGTVLTSTTPPTWARLETLPFPRLGKYQGETSAGYDSTAPAGSPYTLDFIESTMAFFDITFGVPLYQQTELPDATRRARLLNPNSVILPYRIAEEQGTNPKFSGYEGNSNLSLDVQFLNSLPPEWYLRDAEGNIVYEADYPDVALMNVSPSAPIVNHFTFISSVVDWLGAQIFPSGEWDGIYLDNLYDSINAHILNYTNPALIDVDVDRNGTRSTPAQVSEMARSAATSLLQQLRQANGDQQLILVNVGSPALASNVNGFLFECVNHRWNPGGTTTYSPTGWRAAFDLYLGYESSTRHPRTNALEGCGPVAPSGGISGVYYPLPTADDILSHRFTMGTALLSDGFYAFDLHGSQSPPLWYDEYSVDSTGTAVQDVNNKGYLGQALSNATELASPSTILLQETFEGETALPASLKSGAGPGTTVAISQNPSEVITGSGSLVLSNPNHTALGGVSVNTNPNVVQFTAGNSYLLTFDWRVLETVDTRLGAAITTGSGQPLDVYTAPGSVAGDYGTTHIPFVIPSSGQWYVSIYVVNGGKVAIDNIQITQGGIGPWRRDFENGFALVNPFNQPHTFSAADLAGAFNRTGIHRIRGTQAPDVNNGQPLTGDLTLGAFDAIILLADRLNVPGCSYSLDLSGQAFSAQGGTGSITITTGSGCPWNVGTLPAGVLLLSGGSGAGNGAVTFEVLPNVGGSLASSFTIADQTFTIEQQAASIPGLNFIGSMPHIAAEENWTTSFTLVDKNNSTATARLSLFGDVIDPTGNGPLALPLVFPQQATAALPRQAFAAARPLLAASLDRTLGANASLIITTAGPQTSPVRVGSAQLAATAAVDGFAIFHQIVTTQEAVVPMETRNAPSYLLSFDNTNGLVLGVALVNVSGSNAVVPVVIRNDSGVVISAPGASISLPGNGHFSFVLSDPVNGFAVTANIRGTIEFDTPAGGRISVLGLRFSPPNGALTTIPALANVGTGGGSIAHLASGGDGWQTTFVLVNTGASAAQVTLSFFNDVTGSPLSLPLTFPQGGAPTMAPSVTQMLAAGATLVIVSGGVTPQLLTGSAQLTTAGHISGFVIFRHNNQEAVVPLESRNASGYIIAFDNTNGTATGIAVNAVSAGQVNIPVTIRDPAGATIATDILTLNANGHTQFTLGVDKYPDPLTIRGTIEFDTPAGAQIGALGIRIPAGTAHTYTTLPALAK